MKYLFQLALLYLFKAFFALRWAYFGMHPGYRKFTVGNESYFFRAKTNTIHCQYQVQRRQPNPRSV